MRLGIRVTPNAKTDEILGWKDGVLRVKVKAPPVDGKANAALIELLASTLCVPKSAIHIVAGLTDRRKTLEVEAADESVKKFLPGSQGEIPLV